MIKEAIREEREVRNLDPAPGLDGARIAGPSPDDPQLVRIEQARVTVEVATPAEAFFNAYSRCAGCEYWAPQVWGAGHWLLIREGGTGSRLTIYDKPGMRPLTHYGVVTERVRNRRFAWRAPFSQWSRAFIGAILEIEPTSSSGVRVTETLYFDVREDHLPAIVGFMGLGGPDQAAMSNFLEQRLRGLAKFILLGEVPPAGPPAACDQPHERRFRRRPLTTLAYRTAEDGDEKLRENQEDQAAALAFNAQGQADEK